MLALLEDNPVVAALIHGAHVPHSVNAEGIVMQDPAMYDLCPMLDDEDEEGVARQDYVLAVWDLFLDNSRIKCIEWWMSALVTCDRNGPCVEYCHRRQLERGIGVMHCCFSWKMVFIDYDGDNWQLALSRLNQTEREDCLAVTRFRNGGYDLPWVEVVYVLFLEAGVSPVAKSRFFAACCRGKEMVLVRLLSLHAGIGVGKHYSALKSIGDELTAPVLALLEKRMEDARRRVAVGIQKHWLYKPGGPRSRVAMASFQERCCTE